MFKPIVALAFLWASLLTSLAHAAPDAASSSSVLPRETKAQRDARMNWWREAKFGMFIHWGVYSVPAGVYDGKPIKGIGEWIMNKGKIPVARYAEYAKEFDPVKFNADRWVQIAKDAGMKYIVITSKHHDGFAMFHSETSPYNIYDATPFKRDPLKELAAACEKQGIKLGFYYSQSQDWHHPGGRAAGGRWDPAQEGDMTKYVQEIAVPQIREILTNYGRVAVLWFDTPGKEMTKERAEMILPLLKLQPGIIWNNRLGGGYKGDTETPEQHIPPQGYKDRDWETCMTMNGTWGYKKDDHNWKSVETLLHNLIDIASKGGNYLLNVGPTSEGLIPESSVERLAEIGKWMKVNGEAIYGTTATPFTQPLAWGRCTKKVDDKGATLYLHVFDWPKEGNFHMYNKPKGGKWLHLPGIDGTRTEVETAYLLADPSKKALSTTWVMSGLVVKLPDKAPDPISSTVVLRIKGPLEIDQPPAAAVEPQPKKKAKKPSA
jgi:alpha-L-fucosidase